MTPFDLAAQNGHMDVCQLIIENVDDVCPQPRVCIIICLQPSVL